MNEYNLPQKWNLYNFTGLPDFNNWDEGAQANAIYNQRKEELDSLGKTYERISVICAILGILLAFYAVLNFRFFYGLFGILLFLVAVLLSDEGYLRREKVYDELDYASSEWYKVLYKHTDMFIRPVAEKLITGGWYSYRTGQKCLIYNKEGFVYFDTYNSTLVAYNKSNIKDVTRERLHLGSSTSGGSSTTGGAYVTNDGFVRTGGSTQTYSNTVNEYEWHFDIFTDFLDYPKVSLVLNDNKSVEEFTGKAYALLKP